VRLIGFQEEKDRGEGLSEGGGGKGGKRFQAAGTGADAEFLRGSNVSKRES